MFFLIVSCGGNTATSTPIPTNTLSPTSTPIPSSTATLVPVYDISVQVFHDYNGDGTMEQGEPPLEGILNKVASVECTTKIDGTCILHGVQEGKQTINIIDKRPVEKYEMMDFLLPSVSEVRELSKGLDIMIDGDTKISEPLGQGFLSSPFLANTSFKIKNYFDLDSTMCAKGSDPHFCPNVLDWQGNKQTYDDHTGIDLNTSTGTPILAVAPGKVIEAGSTSGWGNHVFIQVNSSYVLRFGHMNTILVKEGDMVDRGQQIGLVGSTGNSSTPHLHLELLINDKFTDQYHNINSQTSLNYWIVLNTPFINK